MRATYDARLSKLWEPDISHYKRYWRCGLEWHQSVVDCVHRIQVTRKSHVTLRSLNENWKGQSSFATVIVRMFSLMRVAQLHLTYLTVFRIFYVEGYLWREFRKVVRCISCLKHLHSYESKSNFSMLALITSTDFPWYTLIISLNSILKKVKLIQMSDDVIPD
jgi:hypothetical protein